MNENINFVFYQYKSNQSIYTIKGLQYKNDKDYIYKFIDYNKFEKTKTKIPKNYKKNIIIIHYV